MDVTAVFIVSMAILCTGCDGFVINWQESDWSTAPVTGLPVLEITTEHGKGISSKDDWVDATASLIPDIGEANNSIELGKLEIKGRGNTTWNYPKKPYALKFKTVQSFFGSNAEKRWVLLANYRDKTLLRNDLAFEISRRTGLAWTPVSIHVELVLNGRYMGNYQLTDQIELSESRVNVDPDGGYLLELDKNYDEYWRFRSGQFNLPVNIKGPEKESIDQEAVDTLEQFIDRFENELIELTSSTPANIYEEYIDTDSFVDWWLVQELMGNGEPNHPKSCFVSKGAGANGKLAMGPVWDFDWSTCKGPAGFYNRKAFWYEKLLKNEEFLASVKTRWNSLKSKLVGDGEYEPLNDYIDKKGQQLARSQELNVERWDLHEKDLIGENYGSYDKYLNAIKRYFEDRISWLDQEINNF